MLLAFVAVIDLGSSIAFGQKTAVPDFVNTPDRVESHLGTLEFKDGIPTTNTAAKLRDEIDYLHGVQAFMNSTRGVSLYAMYKGFHDVGIQDNEFMFCTELMNSKSLFLTGNCDTIYYIGFADLSKGPMVFEAPPEALGVIDDMWFHWITDFGLPGAERGEGGKYLLVPPGYQGALPEGGYIVRKSRTNRILIAGRSFLVDNAPAPTVSMIKKTLKLYPYAQGGTGTSIGSFLNGEASSLGPLSKPRTPRFVEGTGLVINTIMPSDAGFYNLLDELIQMEPAEALDPELAGQAEAIGISKGKKFTPDARMQKILQRAAAVGNAASRSLGTGTHPTHRFRYYGEGSAWWIPLWDGGYQFLNPPPMISKEGVKPFPNSGARKLASRSSFFYLATGITPAMCMRLTGVGSQYLVANVDKQGRPFDGAKTYKVDLPKDIPAARFWSFTVYDNQTRSMLQTEQLYPRAGSQSYPSPAAAPNADGSTTVYFSPKQPDRVKEGNWIRTDPNKGWFTILRLYSPLQSYFDKSWRAGEIEEVK